MHNESTLFKCICYCKYCIPKAHGKPPNTTAISASWGSAWTSAWVVHPARVGSDALPMVKYFSGLQISMMPCSSRKLGAFGRRHPGGTPQGVGGRTSLSIFWHAKPTSSTGILIGTADNFNKNHDSKPRVSIIVYNYISIIRTSDVFSFVCLRPDQN